MLTYGDMVTQVLAFFVLLFSFSYLDQAKFEASLMSIRGALGVLDGGQMIQPQGGQYDLEDLREQAQQHAEQEQLEQIAAGIRQYAAAQKLDNAIRLSIDERGLVIRLADTVLFDRGRAEIKPEARAILDRLAEVIGPIPNNVRVEGHTDNLPINTAEFPSNWELSSRRATNVLRYLVEKHAISAQRMSGSAYGEYRPVAPNTSEEERRLNRRVDIVILRLSAGRDEPK